MLKNKQQINTLNKNNTAIKLDILCTEVLFTIYKLLALNIS